MGKIQVVVPISGGKDSQACLKLALSIFPPEQVRGLFCDTKNEHPDTYAHIQKLRSLYGDVVIDVTKTLSVRDLVLKYGRFPGGGARFCTDETKIRMTKKYLWWLATLQEQGFEVWYGMRTEESHERAKRYDQKIDNEVYPPHEVMPSKYPKYLAKMGVYFRLPVVDWSEKEVLDFLGDEKHPHYAWKSRIGCHPCWAAGDAEKELVFAQSDDFSEAQYIDAITLSKAINKPVFTSKGGQKRNPGACAVCEI